MITTKLTIIIKSKGKINMKKILLSIICLTSFAFMQDECSEITNPEECYDMGCEWIILYQEMGNEIIVPTYENTNKKSETRRKIRLEDGWVT